MRRVMGILAHVDAGKTTLSEGMLYTAGQIRKLGRVDNRDAFLDTYSLERERGITIFSKQATILWKRLDATLLDTPGHVDFSAEMERTLQVLDMAVLVISGSSGVQSHTGTLWQLLKRYQIPTFLFVNKMDQPGTDREALLNELQSKLDSNCTAFEADEEGNLTEETCEQIAYASEDALEEFMEEGTLSDERVRGLIGERTLFPVFFGSALKLDGVEQLMDGLERYAPEVLEAPAFGARVFKISRDAQGNRLTHMKITGGTLKVRDTLEGVAADGTEWEEKINQIRLYSGEKFEPLKEALTGQVVAVMGLSHTRPGDGLGVETSPVVPLLQPVLTYQMILPAGVDPKAFLPKLKELEEEEPELHIRWMERIRELHAQVMGEVQIEVLRSLLYDRYGVEVTFDSGSILYKETILTPVEGVGHFEPLRHYAEVHLLMEPGPRGSGLQFEADVSTDRLELNWQRLVMTHLEEREHIGVLTGGPITDMKITLVDGRAHQKHTEGGDFRQATYRAVRHGLMRTDCVLLEPWYEYRLEVPTGCVGRAMTDLEKMQGSFNGPIPEGDISILTGKAPVSAMWGYQREMTAYTKGLGRLTTTMAGYEPCHNAQTVINRVGYDPERDVDNSADSVFCSHGSGFIVPWDRVTDYMHLPGLHLKSGLGGADGWTELGSQTEELMRLWREQLEADGGSAAGEESMRTFSRRDLGRKETAFMGSEEVDAILARTYGANRKADKEGYSRYHKTTAKPSPTREREWKARPEKKRDKYLLVDGYNIIFAWKDLSAMAQKNVDAARGQLQDRLSNYQGILGDEIILVFDAYRVQGHTTEIFDYHNIHVVFTREAETADQYIEKFTHENGQKYDITVATSDGLEQVIIRGAGSRLLSAMDLLDEINRAEKRIQEQYIETPPVDRVTLFDSLSPEVLKQFKLLEDN